MKTPQRLLIVEEALKNRHGHWYEYNRAIVVEARRRNIHTTILAHQSIENDVRAEMGAQPFFPVTSWDQVYYHPSVWRRYAGILRHNFRVARLMRRHFAANEPYDVVLVPTVVLYHWLAWRWLAWRGAEHHFQKLVLTTRNNAGEYDSATHRYHYGASAKVLKRVVASFRKLIASGRVELASDSSRLASQYRELSGVPVTTYPHPRPTNHLPLPEVLVRDPQRPVVFTALGPPRYEKGSDLILEAVCLLREQRPDLRVNFVLQWSANVYDLSGKEVSPSAKLEADPGVVLIRNSLSSEEYQRHLDAADVLLVPYRRSQYHARLSGVAIEAFQSGVSCICVTDTWIAEAMQAIGTGIAIQEESAADLVRAMIDFVEHRDEWQAKARERIPMARRAHSPEEFVDKLFAKQGVS